MMAAKGSFKFFVSVLALLVLSLACNAPASPNSPVSPVPHTTEPCSEMYTNDGSFFLLDSQPLKDHLIQAGFTISEVNIVGEGEYIHSTCPATPDQPSIRSTSITITILTDTITDTESLGRISAQLLDSLEQFPYTPAPHWEAGTTTFIFQAGTDQVEVSFNGSYAVRTLRKEKKLDGAALWEELQP
jgi:hypothetical protein